MMARVVAVAALLGVMAEARIVRRALNKRISHFEFLDIKEHHIFRRSLGDDKRHMQPFTMPVKMFNRSMSLKLKPAQHLFTENATIHLDGKTEPLSAVGLYTGKIDELDTFNHVHLKIEADGTVQGMIVDGGDAYHIDPVADHFDSPQEADHVVYREADMVYIKPTHMVDQTLAHSSIRSRREGDDDDDEANHCKTISDEAECTAPPSGGKAPCKWCKNKCQSECKVEASKYQKGYDTCHMALWADRSFVQQFGGTNAAVVKMLQRFSLTQEVYASTSIKFKLPSDGSQHEVNPTLKIQNLIVDKDADMSMHKTATAYLEAFSAVADEAETKSADLVRDWAKVCLAHAFTNQDYDGTLGLAWTAYPDKANHNGGICQSQYRDGKGKDVSLNTGFSTSLNFGSQQPELQTTLVLVHEVGHNFGSPHDLTPEQSGYTEPAGDGVHVMYPYAPSGAAQNNDAFSSESADHMGLSMRDRAGCFHNDAGNAGSCGNFVTDEGTDEECDCGGTVSSCNAFDPFGSCDAECKLADKCDCNPQDKDNGLCCSSDGASADYCQKITAVCKEVDHCEAPVSCADGTCGDAAPRQENAMCQDGVAVCTADSGCSSLCDGAGKCSKSICSLFGLSACTTNFGKNDGCQIQCEKDDATGCVSISELAESTSPVGVVTWEMDSKSEVPFTNFAGLSVKAGGSKCAFKEGHPDSGICDLEAQCLQADNEEDALGELYAQYNKIVGTFTDWANDDQSGLANWAWFLIAAFLMLFVCMGLCWRCNKEHVVEAKTRMKRRMSGMKGGGHRAN